MIYHGDSLEVLKTLEPDSVDAIITDPPYGLSFMGKKWDYDVPSVALWREVIRVLRPGGHLLSFGGTRTYHRLASGIEDAGFEIRDQIQWIYGSGFPKSLDVSKAVDKSAGVERQILGYGCPSEGGKVQRKPRATMPGGKGQRETIATITAPATDAAKQWQGFGTALKPAIEPVCLAMKPFTKAQLVVSLAHEICQSKLFANAVQKNSLFNQSELSADASIAQWLAGKSTLTRDGLSALMDTLHSESAQCSSLSIELSWLNTLAAVLISESMFTTEMASSLITDLKILKSLLSSSTQESIIQDETNPHGTQLNVLLVESLFSAVKIKLDCILTPSAHVNVFAEDECSRSPLAASPANEPIVLARKPLSESTVAKNVLKHGTGAINIDGSRIVADDGQDRSRPPRTENKIFGGGKGTNLTASEHNPQGRWPANVLFDESAAQILDEQSGVSKSVGGTGAIKQKLGVAEMNASKAGANPVFNYGDVGGASRFFYVAKASKRERNAGLEGMPEKTWKEQGFRDNESTHLSPRAGAGRTSANQNHHPTVKPIKLMEYLCKLITPPGGVILDPFCGSGSTGVAATRLGFKFIGIEKELDYVRIAEKRIAHAASDKTIEVIDEQTCMSI